MPVFVRTQEVEHQIGPAGRVALRVTSPDVEIKGTEDPVARVRIRMELRADSEAEADEMFELARFDVTTTEDSLDVSEPRHADSGLAGLIGLFGRARATGVGVAVEMPNAGELAYQGVSADLTVTDLTGPQRYRTVSGDLVLDRVSGSVRIQGVSGDVSLRAASPIGLEASTVSGDLSAFAPTFTSLHASTVSGDVELEGGLDPGAAHRVESVSGDLSLGIAGGLTLEVRGLSTDVDVTLPHRAEGSRDRRRYIVGGGEAQLLFSSMSGDASVGSARRTSGTPPVPPLPPLPPAAPVPPVPSVAPSRASGSRRRPLSAIEQLAVLQALERGEIDVDEAGRRLSDDSADV